MTTGAECPHCPVCGSELEPATAWFDGELTKIGFIPCRTCMENKKITDYLRDYWKHLGSGAERG